MELHQRKNEQASHAQQNVPHNNPIPPRPRSHCGADSPRRGEYGALPACKLIEIQAHGVGECVKLDLPFW